MKEPLSSRYAMRSRALHMPACLRFAYLSSPPPASALARRASYSANNVWNDMSTSVLKSYALQRDGPPMTSHRDASQRSMRHRPLSGSYSGFVFGAELRSQSGLQRLDELAQIRAGFPRIDQVFDCERFGSAKRGGELPQFFFDLALALLWICSALDIAPVCSFHTAFDRKRAPVARGPCNLEVEAPAVYDTAAC